MASGSDDAFERVEARVILRFGEAVNKVEKRRVCLQRPNAGTETDVPSTHSLDEVGSALMTHSRC